MKTVVLLQNASAFFDFSKQRNVPPGSCRVSTTRKSKVGCASLLLHMVLTNHSEVKDQMRPPRFLEVGDVRKNMDDQK
jgi:hypothetical protein